MCSVAFFLSLSLVLLLSRSFPAEVYKPLLTSFANVMKSTRSVASATKSFRSARYANFAALCLPFISFDPTYAYSE